MQALPHVNSNVTVDHSPNTHAPSLPLFVHSVSCLPCARLLNNDPFANANLPNIKWWESLSSVGHIHDLIHVFVANQHGDHAGEMALEPINMLEGINGINVDGGVPWAGAAAYSITDKQWGSLLGKLANLDSSLVEWDPSVPQRGRKLTMTAVASGSVYAKFSCDVLDNEEIKGTAVVQQLVHIINALRQEHPSADFQGHAAVYTSLRTLKSVMIMVGGKGRGTGFHVDWTNAVNLAFGIGKEAADADALATWVFIKPVRESLEAVSNWLKGDVSNLYPNGLVYPNLGDDQGTGSLPTLPLEVIERLQASAACAQHVVVCTQKHGCLMNAPVGWPHCVLNHVPCIKIAFDYVKVEDMAKIALSHATTIVPFFRQYGAVDYTNALKDAFLHASLQVELVKIINSKPQ